MSPLDLRPESGPGPDPEPGPGPSDGSRIRPADAFHVEREALPVFRLGLIYLAMPGLIFLLSFARPVSGLAVAALLVGVLGWVLSRPWPREDPRPYGVSLLVALGIAWLVGFPGGPFCWDWFKHWALINTIAEHDWPVETTVGGAPGHLRFYLAAYLPPTLALKALDLPAWLPTAAWFVIGYVLVLRMVGLTVARRGLVAEALAMTALLLMAGADFHAGNACRLADAREVVDGLGLHYEWWFHEEMQIMLQYSSILSTLVWVPHQSIATFLVASMLVLDRSRLGLPVSLLAFGLLALWTPYGMIGLLPMVAVRFLQGGRLRTPVLAASVSGATFALLVACYLATDLPKGGILRATLGDRAAQAPHLAAFLVVELAAFGLILWNRIGTDLACLVSLLTLLVIPLFHGDTPDFVMRVSMGPLFILALRSVETLSSWRERSARIRARWALALVLCAPTAVSEVIYHMEDGIAHTRAASGDPLGKSWYSTFAPSTDISPEEFFDACGWHLRWQYFTGRTPRMIRDEP